MTIVSLLIALLVICLLYWCAMRIMAAFGVGDPIRTVVQVVLVLIVVFWLLGQFGVVSPINLR